MNRHANVDPNRRALTRRGALRYVLRQEAADPSRQAGISAAPSPRGLIRRRELVTGTAVAAGAAVLSSSVFPASVDAALEDFLGPLAAPAVSEFSELDRRLLRETIEAISESPASWLPSGSSAADGGANRFARRYAETVPEGQLAITAALSAWREVAHAAGWETSTTAERLAILRAAAGDPDRSAPVAAATGFAGWAFAPPDAHQIRPVRF